MDTMLSRALREFMTGPLNQLIVNLGGRDSDQWEAELKQFLRKEPSTLRETLSEWVKLLSAGVHHAWIVH